MRSSKKEVDIVLRDMRNAIDRHLFIPVCREENLKTLAALGMLWGAVREEIYTLTYDDNYFSGPEIDRDKPTEDMLWVFKKNIEGTIIYIKFKVMYQKNGEVKVISFHIDN